MCQSAWPQSEYSESQLGERISVVSPPLPSKSHRPWLVIFNCQAFGLANSLSLLGGVQVDSYDPSGWKEKEATLESKLDDYEVIVIAPKFAASTIIDLSRHPNVWHLPFLNFHGYHPDYVHMNSGGRPVSGPIGGWHSMIALAAYQAGVSIAKTERLYTQETYRTLGYFSEWDIARDQLVELYQRFGFDIRSKFVEWSRSGPFMHTPNHPKIFCLRDIAELLLLRAGIDVVDTGILAPDNMTRLGVVPVYPEIGAALGVFGNYRFKPGGRFETFGLRESLSRSFRAFDQYDEIRPEARSSALHARALALMGEFK